MKTRFLISSKYKVIGWSVFIPSLILGLIQFFGSFEPEWLNWNVPAFLYPHWNFDGEGASWKLFTVIENNVADELCASLLLVAALLLVFARERDEDEMIMKIRLESMLWSARVNGVILLFCVIFVYDIAFFYVMILNLFLLFLLFIFRFNTVLQKFRKEVE